MKVKSIKIEEQTYPKNLLRIDEPPKVIYVLGDEKILNDFCIGIVGTRNATKYGEEITKSLAYGLAKHGVNIISGLARGIDTSAHTGTMLAKKRKNNCSFRKWFWKYLPKRKCRTY